MKGQEPDRRDEQVQWTEPGQAYMNKWKERGREATLEQQAVKFGAENSRNRSSKKMTEESRP